MGSSDATFMIVFMTIYCSFILATFAVMYIFESLALFRIATRRNIPKPWLAWIPGGSSWILGYISDQYRYHVHGLVTNRRKTLLTWFIVSFSLLFLFSGLIGGIAGAAVFAESTGTDISSIAIFMSVLLLVAYFGMFAFLIVFSIQQYKALFDLYRSCNPSLAVVFLILSIFVVPSCIFTFVVRNKDDGMVPQIGA